MPTTLARADAKPDGARHAPAPAPAVGRVPTPRMPLPTAARARSPALSPEGAVAVLVESAGDPGAAHGRRQFVEQIQRAHGNDFAARVVAEYRAQRAGKGDAARPAAPVGSAPGGPTVAPMAAAVASAPGGAPAAPAVSTVASKAVPAAPVAAAAATKGPRSAVTAKAPPAASAAALAAAPAVSAKGPSTAAVKGTAEPGLSEHEASPAAGAQAPPTAAAAAAAPASPGADPAFRAVAARAHAVAEQQGHNNPAKKKAAEAQAAAVGPSNEVASQAAAAQVTKMDAQQPQPFDRAGFKAALLAKITEITPKNLKEADEFKKSGGAEAVKGAVTSQVASGKEGAQGSIKAATTEAPDPAAGQPKPVTPMPPTEAGVPPQDIGAAAAAPKPKSDGEVSLQADSQALDRQMADAGVDQKQLEKSNEPEFTGAAQAKSAAQADAQQAPAIYRQKEEAVIAGAQGEAVAGSAKQTQQMHAIRRGKFNLITADQLATQQADKEARAEVARRIEAIFDATREKVEALLARVDKEVNAAFDSGAEQARQAFETYVDERMTKWKIDRYLAQPGGSLLWVKDELLGLPDEVNQFYSDGRALYVGKMDAVIDQVAGIVETGLAQAKQQIAAGRAEVTQYVAGLPDSLKQVGEQAATTIQGKFDTLRQSVDDKGNQLVDQLAQKYIDNLGKLDERIGEMKAGNRGLVDKAKEQLQGVIDTIVGLKNMLLGILAKAAAAIDKIIEDPIAFLGNLVAGVKGGLTRFISNIGTHLKKGLLDWLFGALGGAGLTLPETLDLKGIISLVLQVLGLTYANFRARAVAIVGEPIVQALEQAAEVFKVLVTEGIPGLWRFIKEKLGDLKSMVMDAIFDFVRDRVIMAGITWIIGLLNPASAFVKACKAIYDIVMFFVNRGSQIISLVNAVVDSISEIANGAIGVASTWVENALAKAVPVAIGFLASLLGLGDPSKPVKNTIDKARSPVNAAMDWVIHQAVKWVKAAGQLVSGLFGGKKDKAKDGQQPETSDPQHDAKVTAGLAQIPREEQGYMREGALSPSDAERVAAKIKQDNPVFRSVTAVSEGGHWSYHYQASEGKAAGAVIPEFLVVHLQSFNAPVGPSPPGVGGHRPTNPAILSAAPGDGLAAKVFEANVGRDVAASAGQPMPKTKGSDKWPAKSDGVSGLPEQTHLLKEPKTNLGGQWDSSDVFRRPDFVLLSPHEVEVVEATLDVNFEVREHERGANFSALEHKPVQIAGTVFGIQNKYPNARIVYTIRCPHPPSAKAVAHINNELARARKGGAQVTFTWVFG